MKEKIKFLVVMLFFIIGCGGGGGGDNTPPNPDPDPTTNYEKHIGAFSIGDLMSFEYDLEALDTAIYIPYKYHIIEGFHKDESVTGLFSKDPLSASLFHTKKNYSPLIVYPGSIVIGRSESNNLGMFVAPPGQKKEHVAENISGIYNFIESSGIDQSVIDYNVSYGTISIESNGRWAMAISKDLSIQNTKPDMEGSWIDLGNRLHALNEKGEKVANFSIHPEFSEDLKTNVLVFDLCDQETKTFGIRLGLKQSIVKLSDVHGKYDCINTLNTSSIKVDINIKGEMWVPSTETLDQAIQFNIPWNGFFSTTDFISISAGNSSKILFGSTNSTTSQLPAYFFAGVAEKL